MMRQKSGRLKKFDAFRKIEADLTEATLTGAWISIVATVIICILLVLELSAFLSLKTDTELVVDSSPKDDLLKVSFNISFPALSCEFASVDLSDALGKKRLNLTKTVYKTPIDQNLDRQGEVYKDGEAQAAKAPPKYDEEYLWWDHLDLSQPINHDNFMTTLQHYPIVVVNFYAPWCHWCQRLEPAWEAATKEVHEKYPEATDGRIRFAKVDCTAEADLCRKHFINAFPSIRVFRKTHDEVVVAGQTQHESYTGDRTKEALVTFADSLVPAAGQPHVAHADLTAAPRTPGCNIAGFLMVKRVPGTIHITPLSEAHSFDAAHLNLTHTVHAFHFGARPAPHAFQQLRRLHPLGLTPDWMDKLRGQTFLSDSTQSHHEHWLQVVRTTIRPLSGVVAGHGYDAYEYVAQHHTFHSDSQPRAKFSFYPSPMQASRVVVREQPRAWYKFLTTTCAVVGGVFTVAGILDGILYAGLQSLSKKVELGKQG